MINLPHSNRPVLTKHQEVIRRLLIYENLTSTQIAKQLKRSDKTIKGHLTEIYKLYGVKSKYELMFLELKRINKNGVDKPY